MTEEVTSADESDPKVEEEPSPVDVVSESRVATSDEVKVAPTKLTTNSAAHVGIPAVEPKFAISEEVTAEVPVSLQSTSIQPGSMGGSDQTDGGLLVQMQKLFANNAEGMSNIAK